LIKSISCLLYLKGKAEKKEKRKKKKEEILKERKKKEKERKKKEKERKRKEYKRLLASESLCLRGLYPQ